MNKATLVTALYNYGPTHILGGRGWGFDHYKSPLLNILKLGCPIVFYTDDTMKDRLLQFLSEHSFDNFKIIYFDLFSANFSKSLLDLKKASGLYGEDNMIRPNEKVDHTGLDRNEHICLQKLDWLLTTANKNPYKTEYFYWIDAGIAHHGIFPETFGGREKFIPCESRSYTYYPENQKSIFQPNFIINLNKFVNKFFCIEHKEYPKPGNIHDILKVKHGKYIIGGLFGGKTENIKPVHKVFYEYLKKILQSKNYCLEEQILSAISGSHGNLLQTTGFTHWYHDIEGDFCYMGLNKEADSCYKIFKNITENNLDKL